ncbi:MAG: hypothetical protein MUF81_15880 [Verrucomicrobia bacterium]|jgi:hypothetical protein|nr:hypothetical protein [Verrucomicrobiota bacterium]
MLCSHVKSRLFIKRRQIVSALRRGTSFRAVAARFGAQQKNNVEVKRYPTKPAVSPKKQAKASK